MADDGQRRMTPDEAEHLLNVIRAKDATALRWALINFGDARERFLNTPLSVGGGERTLFLLEAVKTADAKTVTLLLEGGAKPETRTHGETGRNGFHAEALDPNMAALMLSAMRNRIPGRSFAAEVHNAVVGAKDQATDAPLFLHADRRNYDTVFYLLNQLPNDSSRRQAIEQYASPLPYDFDKALAEKRGYPLHPGKSVNLLTLIDYIDRTRDGYRNPSSRRILDLNSNLPSYGLDPAFYYQPRPEGDMWVTPEDRQRLLAQIDRSAPKPLTADDMRRWLEADEPPTMPPPLAQRFLSAIAGGGQPFNGASGAMMKEVLDSFGDDAKEIINTPVLNSDGTRTMLLIEAVNAGAAGAVDMLLKAGADPARRADGGSGRNAFYAEKLSAGQVVAFADAVRAGQADAAAGDKALHDAILGAPGQPTIHAIALQLDGGNRPAAKALYEALPNASSRRHAMETGFSPLGLKVDGEARAAGIYLGVDRCFSLQDIAEFRFEKLRRQDLADRESYSYFSNEAYNHGGASDKAFYYPAAKAYNYMVDPSMRDSEERRFKELRAREVAQQKAYREQIRGALSERDEAEAALKREEAASREQERRLRALVGEITGLEEQVARNDATLSQLGDERAKLRTKMKTFGQGL